MYLAALYYPSIEDEAIQRIGDRSPCQAKVAEVEDGRANLIVVDHLGITHLRNAVAIGPCTEPDYCVLV